MRAYSILLLSLLLLAACGGSTGDDPTQTPLPPTAEPSPLPTDPPTAPPPPTDSPQAAEPAETEEIVFTDVAEEDLIDESGLLPGQIALRYAGVASVEFQPGNPTPSIQVELDPGRGEPETPGYEAPTYNIRITTGQIVEDVRGIVILVRADLEPGTYAIRGSVASGFSEFDSGVLANGLGPGTVLYSQNPMGLLRFNVDEQGQISGSFALTASTFNMDFVRITGAFGPIMPEIETED